MLAVLGEEPLAGASSLRDRAVASPGVIDLRRLRDDASYREGAVRKGADVSLIQGVLAVDEAWRAVTHQAEQARAAQNAASREIGRAAPDERPAKIAEAGRLKDEVERLEVDERATAERRAELSLQVPNPAAADVPSGGEESFETVREVGERAEPPVHDHAEIGALAGLVDSDSGARNSGSRFAYLKGAAVRLEFALVQWTMDLLEQHGFTPVVPPVLVREEMMTEAGFFPADRHQVYEIDGDDLFLIGTSEVALAGLHRGERLDRAGLPLRYAGFSSCFRREAGTHGRDTRGIFRVHQFDKVEMFSFCDSDTSWDELEALREIQEEIVGSLDLPYRVINVAAGDPRRCSGQEVRPRSLAALRARLPRSHLMLELHRLLRPPPRHPAGPKRPTQAAPGPASSTRSTAPPAPSAAPSCSSWRTTSAPTVPSPSPQPSTLGSTSPKSPAPA